MSTRKEIMLGLGYECEVSSSWKCDEFLRMKLLYLRNRYKFSASKRMYAQFPILLQYCWLKRILGFVNGNKMKSKARLNNKGIGKDEYTEMKLFLRQAELKKRRDKL